MPPLGEVFTSYLVIFPATLPPFCQRGSQLSTISLTFYDNEVAQADEGNWLVLATSIRFMPDAYQRHLNSLSLGRRLHATRVSGHSVH